MCPTAAFPAPYRLDARRCISYLTIEHRTAIPVELRPLMGELVYGCDICQDVCPWNQRFARELRDAELQPRRATTRATAREMLGFTDADFRGEIEMFGRKSTRGSIIVNMVLSGRAAYRTQLFMYLKTCGREELGTMNLWAGVDAPAPV